MKDTSKKYSWQRRADLYKRGYVIRDISATAMPLDGWTLVEEAIESAYSEELLETLVNILKEKEETDEIQ